MSNEVTRVRVPMAVDVHNELLTLAGKNCCSLRDMVDRLVSDHCWWITQLYRRPDPVQAPR